MIVSKGKNRFENHTFSYWEWSAPILQTHNDVISKINELQLQGKVIKSFYTVGMGYDWTEDDIAESIYRFLEKKIKKKEIEAAGPFPFLPENVHILRHAEIDEPFLIEFEDGDILAVDYSEGSCVRMELNTIPKDIHFGTNRKTFHPNVLFKSLIGAKIVNIEVTTSIECDEFTGSHGLYLGEQDAYIAKLSFVCQKEQHESCEKLSFSSWLDYGTVVLTNDRDEPLTIHAPDIKEVVEGFLDEELLNSLDEYYFNK